MKKTLKRTLSIVLTLMMLICVVQTGFIVSYAADVKSADTTIGETTFIVPEAIYLYPNGTSWKVSTTTPFQYYINNDCSTGATKSNKDTTGYCRFTYSGNTTLKPTISYSFLTTGFAAMTGGSVTLSTSTPTSGTNFSINGGTAPSLSKTDTGCYIQWVASFTDPVDGLSKKVTAYTYVYKPYVVPVGGFVRVKNSFGTASYGSHVAWLSGVHSINVGAQATGDTHDGNYYPNFSGAYGLSGFITSGTTAYYDSSTCTASTSARSTSSWKISRSGASRYNLAFLNTNQDDSALPHFNDTSGHNDTNPQTWGNTSSSAATFDIKSFDYGTKNGTSGTDRNAQAAIYATPKGVMTIDTSRYSDLSQIPNLGVGVMSTDNEHTDSSAWYVADYTQTSSFTPRLSYNGSFFKSGSDQREEYYQDFGYIIAGECSSTTWDSWPQDFEGLCYAGPWVRTLLSGTDVTYAVKSYYGTNDGSDYSFGYCSIGLDVKQYNKTNLRSAVTNATKAMAKLGVNAVSNGTLTSCYFDADSNYKWTAFQSAYKEAVKALCKVDGTISDPDTLAANLNNAVSALCTKISFSGNGGSLSSSSPVYVTVGTSQKATYTPSLTASRTGYSFNGWSLNSNATSGSTYVTVGYNNTVYATWTPKTFSVSFNGNGSTGGSMADESFTYNEAKALTANAFERKYTVSFNAAGGTCSTASSVAAYTFAGWNNAADGSGSYNYTNGQSVTNPNGSTGGNTTLYAKWNSAPVTLPTASKSGYTFNGWWTAASGGTFIGNEGDSYTPAGGTTLYAHWTNNVLSVSFNGNGNTGGTMQNEEFTYNVGKNLTANGFTKKYTVTFNANGGTAGADSAVANYVFAGWNSAADGNGTYSYTDRQNVTNPCGITTGSTTLYAKWTPAPVTLPSASRTGYRFAGWWTAQNGGTYVGTADDTYTPNGTTTLYAHWTEKSLSVSFYGNGSTGGSMADESFSYNIAKALNANEFERKYTVNFNANSGTCSVGSAEAEYEFTGWNSSSEGNGSYSYQDGQSVTNPCGISEGNTALYAQWESDSVMLPAPEKTGFTFAGWWTKQSGGAYVGNAGMAYTPAASITLYAHWTSNTISVKFDGNGKTGGSMSNQSFTFDVEKNLNANVFERKYTVTYNANGGTCATSSNTAVYTFTGWNSSSDGNGTYSYTDRQAVTNPNGATGGNTILYAKWQPASVTLPVPERAGYAFAGWYDARSGGNRIGGAGDTFTPTATSTFYAHWTSVGYTITYNLDGGTVSVENPVTYTVETTTFTLRNPVKLGYTFAGWSGSNGSAPQTTVTVLQGSTGDRSYTANWTANTYSVTLQKNGGTVNAGNITSYTYGVGAALPVNVTRNGYSFAGWYNNSALTGSAVSSIGTTETGIKTFYAKWNIENYGITYDLGGGSVSGTNPTGYTVETPSFVLLNPVKTGYRFTGWTGTGLSAPTNTVTVANGSTGDKAFTANWAANTNTPYRVEHYVMGTNGAYPAAADATENRTGTSDAELTLSALKKTSLEVPGAIEFSFGQVGGATVPATTVAPDGSRVIKLYYVRNQFTVALTAGTGISSVSGAGTYYYGQNVSIAAAVTDGFSFTGWSDGSTELSRSFEMPAEAVSLTADAVSVPADYSALDALIASFNQLNPEDYTNYDEIYWTYIYDFIDTYVPAHRSYRINDQAEVDAMTAELQSYLDMLEAAAPAPVARFEVKGTAVIKSNNTIVGVGTNTDRAKFQREYCDYENVSLRYTYSGSRRYLGTGSVVTVTNDLTGEVIGTYTIVVFGDVDGDGAITMDDATIVDNAASGATTLSGVYKTAADVAGRRVGIDADDVSTIVNAYYNKTEIDQVTGKGH